MSAKLTTIAVLCAALGLAGCGSVGPTIGDVVPQWAGGLPKDTPPRPGTPEYEEYQRRIMEPKAPAPSDRQSQQQQATGAAQPAARTAQPDRRNR